MSDISVTVTTTSPGSVSYTEGNFVKDTHASEKFTATAGQTVFSLLTKFRSASCRVFKNGILQEKDVDYTETGSRTSVTFAGGCDAGDKIEVDYVQN